jgi:hypothetical protein
VSSSRDTYFVRIDETLVWRRAGGRATRKAGERGFARFARSLIERALWKRPDGRSWRRGARGGALRRIALFVSRSNPRAVQPLHRRVL